MNVIAGFFAESSAASMPLPSNEEALFVEGFMRKFKEALKTLSPSQKVVVRTDFVTYLCLRAETQELSDRRITISD